MYSGYSDLIKECSYVLKNENYVPDNETDSIDQSALVSLIQGLMFFQKQVHIWHLQTDSYAEHNALGEFYEAIEGCIDKLSESYIGIKGKFKVNEVTYQFVDYVKYDAIRIFEEKQCTVSAWFNRTANDSTLNGSIGNISELFASTLYKLKELK